jgi:glycosyltransferase involved in cell wall biosynthesis
MKSVILYTHKLNKFGGIETFIFNFCKRMAPLIDLRFVFYSGDQEAIIRLSDYCSCIRYEQQKLEAETVILASAWGNSPESTCTAKKFIQMVHADYDAYIRNWNFTYKPGIKTTHHIAVGQHVKTSFESITGLTIDKVIYNLLDTYCPEPKTESNILRLITLSRIAREKGFERMLKFCQLLSKHKVAYTWDVWGSGGTGWAQRTISTFSNYPIKFRGITYEPQKEINKADYLVQLSDTEGMPYCIQEALQALTPVITTNYPSVHELVKDGENGYILDMELSNFDIEKLQKIPKLQEYKEKSTEADWLEIL